MSEAQKRIEYYGQQKARCWHQRTEWVKHKSKETKNNNNGINTEHHVCTICMGDFLANLSFYASPHARSVFGNALGIITLQNVSLRNLLLARI